MEATDGMNGLVWRTPAVAVERVEVPAGLRLRGHGHGVPHLCFVECGAVEERHAGRWRRLASGTLRSSPAGDEHDLRFPTSARCLLILLHGAPAAVAPRLPEARRFLAAPRIHALASRLALHLAHRPAPSPLVLEALVLELAATALAGRPDRRDAAPPWLARVREQLRDQPATPPSQLAAEVGYHPVYVARAFRRYYGLGLGQYTRMVRAEHARRLLATTDAPLAQLALQAGYADQSHLCRAMRRFFDTTPSQVRKKQGRLLQVARVQESLAPAP